MRTKFFTRQIEIISGCRSLARILGIAFLALAFWTPLGIANASGTYTGTVFRDYNANGTQDTREPGIGGITVTIYDAANASKSATTFATVCAGPNSPAGFNCTAAGTPALGSYSIDTAANPALANGPYRVEFTGPPSYFQPGANPSGLNASQTTVQFVNNGGGTVNLGLNNPAQYVSSTNPRLATTVLVQGAYTGTYSGSSAAVSFPYNSAGTTAPTQIATHGNIGAAWGIAFAPGTSTQGTLYVSAFQKRLSDFGPNGSGAIYTIPVNPATGAQTATPALFATIPNTNGAHSGTWTCTAGTGQCDGDGGSWNTTNSTSLVGKAGLGALVISDDFKTLYTVNLSNKSLYSVSVPGGVVTQLGGGSVPIPHPTCTNGTDRPFGLGFRDGKLYMGGVCDASGNSGTAANLTGYVYQWDPTTSFTLGNITLVLSFPLSYTRGCANFGGYSAAMTQCRTATGTNGPTDRGPKAAWSPWTDSIATAMVTNVSFQNDGGESLGGSYPMPLLSKIQFDNTDMIIGLRDRFGDMFGDFDPGPNGSNPIKNGTTNVQQHEVPAGDILRANPNTLGGWTLESAGKSSPTGIFAGPSIGQANGQGPGSGEFYCEEWMLRHHEETSFGGVLQVPGFGEVSLTANDPVDDTAQNPSGGSFTAGVIQLSNTTGTCVNPASPNPSSHGTQRIRNYQIYPSGGSNFYKANGLGDMVALLAPAPIEIGNRVWNDTTKNGRQDPGEANLANVTIGLYNSTGTLIEFVETDSNGNFLFSSASGTNVTGKKYGVNIQPNTQYTVAIYASEFNVGGTLAGQFRTIPNFDGQINNNAFTDIRDSDLVTLASTIGSGDNAATLGVVLSTGLFAGAGYNNHSVDFGISATPTAIDMGKVSGKANADGSVTLRWESFTEINILGFNVLRGVERGALAPVNSELVPARSMGFPTGNAYEYTDATANPATAYFYRIEIVRPVGDPERSNTVKVTTAADACASAPLAPGLVGPADGHKSKSRTVTFRWGGVECAVRYKFQLRLETPEGETLANQKDAVETEATVGQLKRGKSYVWRAAGCNASDKCEWSGWWKVEIRKKSKP